MDDFSPAYWIVYVFMAIFLAFLVVEIIKMIIYVITGKYIKDTRKRKVKKNIILQSVNDLWKYSWRVCYLNRKVLFISPVAIRLFFIERLILTEKSLLHYFVYFSLNQRITVSDFKSPMRIIYSEYRRKQISL